MPSQREYEIHPAAKIFPMMKGRAFDELVADIRENGQEEPITFYDGMVLDGRNRLKACQVLGIEPETAELDMDQVKDPVVWVLSMNLHRRHLGETEREAIAGKIANLKHGDNQHKKEDAQFCASSNKQAAEQLNVKPRNVQNAKTALKGGCKKLVEALETGEIPSSTAASFVKAVPDKEDQTEVLKGGLEAVRKVIKESKQDQSRPTTKLKERPKGENPKKYFDSNEYADAKAIEDEPEDSVQENKISVLVGIRRNLQTLTFEQLVVIQEYVASLLKDREPTR